MMRTRVHLPWVCALILCACAASVGHAQTFPLGGTWVCNLGRVRLIPPVTPDNRKITIEQVGPRLTLVDETGQSSSGQLADVDEIAAPGWSYGERGYVGINVDGTFYRYKDAVQRFKVPEDAAWNFIRWDSGQLCVRA